MIISEEQFKCWSHQGSIKQSRTTYSAIKDSLIPINNCYEQSQIFLQGSYGNDTNIYAESDVDIVLKVNHCFFYNQEELSETQKGKVNDMYPSVSFDLMHLKKQVQDILEQQYPGQIQLGDKAITIMASNNRRKADVIVAMQFRRYPKFLPIEKESYEDGICFYSRTGKLITNFPKQHSENLTQKHQDTNNQLKPMIRIFKNMNKNGMVTTNNVSSYALECMLFNVPLQYFQGTYQQRVKNILNWIQKTDRTKFQCVNKQCSLFSEEGPWTEIECIKWVNAAIQFLVGPKITVS